MKYFLCLIASIMLIACSNNEDESKSQETSKTQNAQASKQAKNPYDFNLSGVDKSYHLADFKGKKLVIYFGYTLCADICPTTLAIAGDTLKELDAKNTELIFISLDPKRDNPKDMSEYVKYFYPSSIGLVPSPSELERLSKAYGVKYQYIYQDSAAEYTVAHSSSLYLIDENSNFKGEISNLAHSNVVKKFKEFLNN